MNPLVTKVYLDTNIFINFFEPKEDMHHALIDLLAATTRSFFVTSELTLAELLVDPYRNGDERLIQLYDNWTISNEILEVGPVSRDALYYAAVLRARYKMLKLPDAIHLATAFGFQCSHFLTGDDRISGEYELTNTRYGLTRGPLVLRILRPTPDIVSALKAIASK